MIKFEVRNRWSGEVQFTAEIDCNEGAMRSVKLGLAVRWGVRSGADLSGANLSDANLSGADLSGADLSGADLSGADLSGANLSRADLSGANLSRADLSGADLSGADLSGANLSRANLSGANLSRADLSRANLSRADLSGANLSRADLSGANLSRADLSDANLSGANLSRADLSGADLSGANLSGAKGIAPEICTPLLMLLDQPGKIRAYKLVNEAGEGPFSGGIRYEIGKSVSEARANCDPTEHCGAGINVATLDWCLKEWRPGYHILIVEFEAKDIACIPTATDGKFRLHRCDVVAEKQIDPVALGLVKTETAEAA